MKVICGATNKDLSQKRPRVRSELKMIEKVPKEKKQKNIERPSESQENYCSRPLFKNYKKVWLSGNKI